MTNRILIVALIVFLVGCSEEPTDSPGSVPTDSAGGVDYTELAQGVWVHTSYRDVEGFGSVMSNGLALVAGEGGMLIDTGWSEDADSATAAILKTVEREAGARVTRAVLTHFHDDSVGGIGALRAAGVTTYAASQTADLMDPEGWGRPDSVLTGDAGSAWTLSFGEAEVEVFYPGPGHTSDNVVLYVPHARVLYTGCLVRPSESRSLGNTEDASIEEWEASVGRVRDRYAGRVDVVVPSHGTPGGVELLDHTIALVEAQ